MDERDASDGWGYGDARGESFGGGEYDCRGFGYGYGGDGGGLVTLDD